MANLQDIRLRLSERASTTVRFYRANKTLLLSTFAIFSIMLIVWARFGFSLDFSRSSAGGVCQASNTTAECSLGCSAAQLPGDTQPNTMGCTGGATCCVNKPAAIDAATFSGMDGRWFTSGLYDPACSAPFYFRTERTKPDGSAFGFPEWCQERPQDCPDNFHAVGDTVCAPNVVIPPVSPSPSTTVLPSASVLPAATPTVSIGAVPTTLNGVALGTINGTSADAVSVTKVIVVLRKNPGVAGACTADSQDWNGSAWVTGCAVAGQLYPPITPGTSAPWSVSNTPPLSQMTPGLYRIFAGAFRSENPLIWSGYATKDFTYADIVVTVTPSPTVFVSPVLSPSLSPVVSVAPAALTCAPVTQTVAIGQDATVTAVGGTGVYNWIALENGSQVAMNIQGATAVARYTIAGTHNISVSSGNETKACQVVVQATQTTLPAQAALSLAVTGRNVSTNSAESETVSVLVGQQVEMRMRIRNLSTTTNISSVIVRATLPAGLSYIPGSTTVGGVATGVDSVNAGGLSVGAIGPGQEVLVALRATVETAQFPVGTTQVQAVAQTQATEIADVSDSVTFSVTRAVAGTTGVVQTGPGEALLAAFLVSAIMTLLYVSYTHSSTYRRREVSAITRDRDPLDFRS